MTVRWIDGHGSRMNYDLESCEQKSLVEVLLSKS